MKKSAYTQSALLTLREQEMRQAELHLAVAQRNAFELKKRANEQRQRLSMFSDVLSKSDGLGVTHLMNTLPSLRQQLQEAEQLHAEAVVTLDAARDQWIASRTRVESLNELRCIETTANNDRRRRMEQRATDVQSSRKWFREGRRDQ